ncbi:hypothetical protein H3C66_04400 [Patescibacteria group bacterium]|nr:hypothetical protein [Patescibacteria group bacterium]
MPAKAKRPVKKPAVKASSRRVPARPAVIARRPVAKEGFWTKQHFMREQNEFFSAHPNSKILLALFTGVLAFYLFIAWSNRMELFPQIYKW